MNQHWLNWRMVVVGSPDLTFQEKAMALYLNTYMNDRHDFAFPSLATICGELGITDKSATKYLVGLEKKGFIARQKRFGNSTVYYALIPSEIGNLSIIGNSTNSEGFRPSIGKVPAALSETFRPNKQVNNQENNQHQDVHTSESRRFRPPDSEQVQAYISEKGYQVNAEAFCAYYESNGWKVGRSPMKDWRAAVRTWQAKGNGNGTGSRQQSAASRFMENLKNA